MTIMQHSHRKVKPTRVSPRDDRPFGAGLTHWTGQFTRVDHTAEDESWWAIESHRLPEPMAREWESRFERAVLAGEVCCRCGLPPEDERDGLRNGHCEACRMGILESERLDRLTMAARQDVPESPMDAPIFCGICGQAMRVEPDTGLCERCEALADDQCSMGNGGY